MNDFFKMNVLLDTVEKIKSFNKTVSTFPCDFEVISGRYIISAQSLIGLFSLDLSKPITLNIPERYEEIGHTLFSRWEVE